MSIQQNESGRWDVSCDGAECPQRYTFSGHDTDFDEIKEDMENVGWKVYISEASNCFCPDCDMP